MIDRSFERQLGRDKDDEVIVSAILAMSRALQLQLVAEGVESQLQFDWLKQHHCDIMPGWLFGKAVPVKAFENLPQWRLGDPAAASAP